MGFSVSGVRRCGGEGCSGLLGVGFGVAIYVLISVVCGGLLLPTCRAYTNGIKGSKGAYIYGNEGKEEGGMSK